MVITFFDPAFMAFSVFMYGMFGVYPQFIQHDSPSLVVQVSMKSILLKWVAMRTRGGHDYEAS